MQSSPEIRERRNDGWIDEQENELMAEWVTGERVGGWVNSFLCEWMGG